MLRFNQVTIAYKEIIAVKDFDLTIQKGRVYCLIGKSGCGKSSLINGTMGFVDVCKGNITAQGKLGLVPQGFSLLPWKTLEKNIELGLIIQKEEKEKRKRRVHRMMEQLEIQDLKTRYPLFLSGGQQQRGAVARAMVIEPDVLLMDEPFSGLDQITREAAQDTIQRIKNDDRIVFICTHSIEEAVFLGDQIGVMSPDGKLFASIDNPGMGQRTGSAYHKMCDDVRTLLKRSKNQ